MPLQAACLQKLSGFFSMSFLASDETARMPRSFSCDPAAPNSLCIRG